MSDRASSRTPRRGHSARVVMMGRFLQHLRFAVTTAGLSLVFLMCAGCDDTPPDDEHPEPGLEILTPTVGVPGGGRATILLRSNQPSRVSVYDQEAPIGTGRSGREVTEIRFTVPDWVSSGVTAKIQVIAVSEGGMTETTEVTLEGLGSVDSWQTGEAFSDIAAVGATAVLLGSSGLWTVTRGDTALTDSGATGEFLAIADDDARSSVVVAEGLAVVSSYSLSDNGELNLDEQFEFAIYDGSSPPEQVSTINALHVNGPLVAAATEKGMALMDRDTIDDGETFCRRRSAMTAKLEPANYIPAMYAVIVTESERVVAGGAYLNVYEAYQDSDPGGCDPPMPDRGTSVIAPPEAEQSWDIVALALTSTYTWIGRREQGILRLPSAFETENHYFRSEDVWALPPEALPSPLITDLAEGVGDRLWVALSDPDELEGGLALIGAEGVDLWIDGDALGGVPRAIDVSNDADQEIVWLLSDTTITAFTAP